MVFAKDHWIGSSFVGVGAESGSSYQLLGGPVIMLEAAKFYIQRLFSPVTWVVLAALAAWVLRQRSWRPLAALALLGAAAILPMLLIPNHRFVMYTWFASSILLLVLPIASTRILAMPRNVALWSLALIAVTVLALWSESRFLSIHRGWYEYNQRMNANIMRSLHVLSTQLTPGRRYLSVASSVHMSPTRTMHWWPPFCRAGWSGRSWRAKRGPVDRHVAQHPALYPHHGNRWREFRPSCGVRRRGKHPQDILAGSAPGARRRYPRSGGHCYSAHHRAILMRRNVRLALQPSTN
jgi:hypothetical protein